MTAFDRDGCLPPGDHALTLASLRAAVLVTGTPALRAMGWDAAWRTSLVDPHFLPPFEATSVAATNAAGQAVSFPDFFRFGRDGNPRGIVRVAQEGSLC